MLNQLNENLQRPEWEAHSRLRRLPRTKTVSSPDKYPGLKAGYERQNTNLLRALGVGSRLLRGAILPLLAVLARVALPWSLHNRERATGLNDGREGQEVASGRRATAAPLQALKVEFCAQKILWSPF